MLLVTVELIPAGFTPLRRTIGSMRISNIAGLAEISDYQIEAIEAANPVAGTLPRSAECVVSAHARNQSVWVLLQRACEEIIATSK